MEVAMRRATTTAVALAIVAAALCGGLLRLTPEANATASQTRPSSAVTEAPTAGQYYQDPDDWRRREYRRERRRAEEQARIEDAARREAWRIEQERAQRRAERRAWRDDGRRWREEQWRREQWERQQYAPPPGVIIQRGW
jgi:hypothetical protein